MRKSQKNLFLSALLMVLAMSFAEPVAAHAEDEDAFAPTVFEVAQLKAMSARDRARFDEELDRMGNNFSLWNSAVYPRMLAYRMLIHGKALPTGRMIKVSNKKANLSQIVNDLATEIKYEMLSVKLQTNTAPAVTADGKIIKRYGENIVGNEMPANSNRWILTYDDGPQPSPTKAMLKFLKESKIKASFFLVSREAMAYPKFVEQQKEEGHMIANHSFSHKDLRKQNAAGLEKQITYSTTTLREKFGADLINFFRCPYGSGFKNTNIKDLFRKNKLVHVFWNVDTLDWDDPNPETIAARALKQMAAQKNRGVILFHDIHSQTLKATVKVIEKSPNAQWLRLDEAFETTE